MAKLIIIIIIIIARSKPLQLPLNSPLLSPLQIPFEHITSDQQGVETSPCQRQRFLLS
jgi:hypothetical protein